jgi:hypothetical protein
MKGSAERLVVFGVSSCFTLSFEGFFGGEGGVTMGIMYESTRWILYFKRVAMTVL